MSKESFENQRWSHSDQSWQQKHELAYKLFKTLPHWTEAKVLSVAEGDGLFLSNIECGSKFAVDFSQVAVDKCRKKGIETIQYDVEKYGLPYANKEFDCVFLIDILEHCWKPEDLLREARKIGKNIVVTVPNFSFAKDRLQCLFGLVPQIMGAKKGHCYWMNWNSLNEVINKAGLEVQKTEYYFPLNTPLTNIIGRVNPNLFSTMFAVLLKEK